jgi:uncharacterized protein YifE (UPF0438 family)
MSAESQILKKESKGGESMKTEPEYAEEEMFLAVSDDERVSEEKEDEIE